MASIMLDALRSLIMGAAGDALFPKRETPAPVEDRSVQMPPAQPQGASIQAVSPRPVNRNPMVPDTTQPYRPTGDQSAMFVSPERQMRQDELDQEIELENKITQRAKQLMTEAPEGDPKGAAALANLEASGMIASNPRAEEKAQANWSDFFGDEETMYSLALAFNSLRHKPDQGLAGVLGKRLEKLGTQRKNNLTIQKLMTSGDPMYRKVAELMSMGMPLKDALEAAKKGSTLDKDLIKGESDLRKEFTSLPTVKDFQSQSTAFGRVVASAKDPSAAGDLALIFNYMKVLDPGSTVREGEFATAQNASGVPGRVQSLYNNIIRGERLNPEQRSDFVDRARRLYMSAASSYENIRDDYTDIARSYQFDISRTVPDLFAQQKDIVDPPKPAYSSLPKSARDKYTADQFDSMWNGMSYLTKLQLSGAK